MIGNWGRLFLHNTGLCVKLKSLLQLTKQVLDYLPVFSDELAHCACVRQVSLRNLPVDFDANSYGIGTPVTFPFIISQIQKCRIFHIFMCKLLEWIHYKCLSYMYLREIVHRVWNSPCLFNEWLVMYMTAKLSRNIPKCAVFTYCGYTIY